MKELKRIKVLVIDDSAAVRRVLHEWLSKEADMEVMLASDPYAAVEVMKRNKPDVITLDIEMPRMDGLTFLRKLMGQHPIPVIVISSLTEKGCDVTMRALTYGAIDIFLKEDMRVVTQSAEAFESLVQRIRVASKTRVRPYQPLKENRNEELVSIKTSEKTVVMGASTGGTQAIKDIVSVLPINSPGMVVVQHMPKAFTKSFADHLNELCKLTVKEAEDGETVVSGKVLIAPGDCHVRIVRDGSAVRIKTWDGPRVNLHKPSVDVLFGSAAHQLGVNGIGVLLTGMGKDGAAGLLQMKESGATTIAQDEETSVVYGMPGEAARINAAQKVLPLEKIARQITLS